MVKFDHIAPVVIVVVAASFAGTASARAQPGNAQDCRFTGGLGPNSACASAPQDDYSDLILYPPTRGGFGGYGGLYGGYGAFYGDDTPPGISAGPG